MPFAVFRQHQRKLLAVFAILAMVGFVLSDTLPRWTQGGGVNDRDYVVADLFDRPVRRSDLAEMDRERQRANQFMAYISGEPRFFGGTTQDELVDALILRHEADRLEIPATAAYARRWIDQVTNGGMTSQMFEMIRGRNNADVSGEELLITLANQIRILMARQEVATTVVTPLDVYQNYRDQTERASFKAVPFQVDSFLANVGEPPEAEVESLYQAGKDLLPDPLRVAPGFKVPRKVKVEYVAIDASKLAREIKEKLPEADVLTYYEGRKKEFPLDGNELPADLFLGAPQLTPPRYIPFAEQKDLMADALARERADEQVADTLDKVRDEVVDADADKYHDREAEVADARKEGKSADDIAAFKPSDLAAVAAKYGLTYEASPLMDQEDAERFGRISTARAGTGRAADAQDFDHTIFDAKSSLYEGIEFADATGDRYLARKVADEPAHVAPLDQVRDQVVRAWKVAKARPLARKAAEDYAAQLRNEGGGIKGLTVQDRPVITVADVTKLKPGMPTPSQVNGQFRFDRGPASPTAIPELPEAGPVLIDALFALRPGQVAVEPNQPETAYFVATLDRRDVVPFSALMGPLGAFADYGNETRTELLRKGYTAGMTRLRELAHYKETKVGELVEGKSDGSTE